MTPTATAETDLRAARAAAEKEQAAAAEATAKAAAAEARATAAAAALERQQNDARERWARATVAAWPERRDALRRAVGTAREAFESAVVTDPASCGAAYLALMATQAEDYATGNQYVSAQNTLGNMAPRPPVMPEPDFAREVATIITRRSYQLIDEATARMRAQQQAVIDGTDPKGGTA